MTDAVLALQSLPLTTVANTLHVLPWTAIIDGLLVMQDVIQPVLQHIDALITDGTVLLQTVQTYLQDFSGHIVSVADTVDDWIMNIHTFQTYTTLIQRGIYVVIGYVVCLHTAFLLIGIVLHKKIAS